MVVGLFIQNHYREASAAIHSLQMELADVCAEFRIAPEEFESYLASEKTYLEGLKAPSPSTSLKVQYVQALNDLHRCQ